MNDLLPWLRAQFDEDEQTALACTGREWTLDGGSIVSGHPTNQVVDWTYDDNGPHIALHDPKRELRDIEAKRRIVRLHERALIRPGHPYFNDARLTSEPMTLCMSCEPETQFRRERSWPCRTLRTIAELYDDRPGYREEWWPVETPDQWATRIKAGMAKAVNFVDENGRVDASLPGWPWGTPSEP